MDDAEYISRNVIGSSNTIEMVNSLKPGDIFRIKTGYRDDTYIVADMRYDNYDENFDQYWTEPVPIYKIICLTDSCDYEGIITKIPDADFTLLG